MPNVVVVGGSIVCPHNGKITFTAGSASLDIAGAQVITAGMEAGLSFAGPPASPPCPNPQSSSSAPCALTSGATSGVSTVLIAGGAGALTDAATGPVASTPPGGVWRVSSAGQSVVEVSQ